MNELSIDILITTWPNHPLRFDYFCQTVEGLKKYLSTGKYAAQFMVFAEREKDAGHRWMGTELTAYCRGAGIPLAWKVTPPSLPKLLNEMHGGVASDLRFCMQDDWLLTKPLNLEAAANFLLLSEDVGGIRFWANTQYDGQIGPYLNVDRRAAWSYGDNPALWHRRFFDACGPFEEAGEFGTHEALMCKKAAEVDLKILAAAEMAQDASFYFRHIGDISSLPKETRWPDRDRNRISN
jgi:hypothetical protein